jgi:hypothetical protein
MSRLLPFLLFLVLIASSSFLSSDAVAQSGDRCTEWMTDRAHDGIDLMVCEYAYGGSGYNRWRNRYDRDARISFEFRFGGGRAPYTASTPIPAHGVSGDSSCWACADSNGGLSSWAVTRFALQGDPGFF